MARAFRFFGTIQLTEKFENWFETWFENWKIWFFGTDKSFLNNCGNDLRYFSALCDFSSKKILFGQSVLLSLYKCFRLKKVPLESLKLHFSTIRLFLTRAFSQEMGSLLFPVDEKWVFESKRTPSGVFWHWENDKMFFENSVYCIFRKLGFLELERGANLVRSLLLYIFLDLFESKQINSISDKTPLCSEVFFIPNCSTLS